VAAWRERARSLAPGLVGSVAGTFAFVALAGAMVSGNGRYTHLAIVLALGGFGSLILFARETLRSSQISGGPRPEAGADVPPASAERT
jgi:low temperature requirement protein LtrA